MASGLPNDELQEYRIALTIPGSRKVYAQRTTEGLCLPRVSVSLTDRPGEALQATVRSRWGISAYVADYLRSACIPSATDCVIGEVLAFNPQSELLQADPSQLCAGDLADAELAELQLRIDGKDVGITPVCRVGWLQEAYRWAENAVGCVLADRSTVQQFNMGGGFALLRIHTVEGRHYWIKATGAPNSHEYRVTRLIADFAGATIPRIVASRDDWNAWLMEDASEDVNLVRGSFGDARSAFTAVTALVDLQVASQTRLGDLLNAGAFDQRPAMSEAVSRELFEYFEECMAFQTSRKVAPLNRADLQRTRDAYLSACDELADLEAPFSLLHGELSGGNVALGPERITFLDWCEAYIGYSIASLHHLWMCLERRGVKAQYRQEVISHYCSEWTQRSGCEFPKTAIRWAPLMASSSTAYGRGEWLQDEKERNRPARRAFSRTLARHMARESELIHQGVLLCL